MSGTMYKVKLFRKVKYQDGYTSKIIIRSTVPIDFPNFIEWSSDMNFSSPITLAQTGVRKQWRLSFRFPFLRRVHIPIYEFRNVV